MLSFIFGDKDSYDDYGVYIQTRPTIPTPKRRVTYLSIPGRSGSLKYDEGSYEDITLTVECSIVGEVYSKIEQIKKWLFESAESDLIFNFEPHKKYIAQVVNQIDFEISLKRIGKFLIVFNCHPLKYATQIQSLIITENETLIVNPGTLGSEPIIEVVGTGNIKLKLNNQEIRLKDIESNITLNSVIQDAYDERLNNLNLKVQGNFLYFTEGINVISWTGEVTQIVIQPNWRWL